MTRAPVPRTTDQPEDSPSFLRHTLGKMTEMSEQPLHDPAGPSAVGESRAHVLDVLRAASEAIGVREIAEQTGLHPNTARFHLDTLVGEGLAERRT